MNNKLDYSILERFTVRELLDEVERREDTTVFEMTHEGSDDTSDEVPELRGEDLYVLFEEGALLYLPDRNSAFSFRE